MISTYRNKLHQPQAHQSALARQVRQENFLEYVCLHLPTNYLIQKKTLERDPSVLPNLEAPLVRQYFPWPSMNYQDIYKANQIRDQIHYAETNGGI